jgi:iron complex outermembrane receptor protein
VYFNSKVFMKRFFIMAALATCTVAAWAGNSKETKVDSTMTYMLQGVQVTSTRATKTTPFAFKNLNQKQIKQVNFGQDIPYVLSLNPIGHHHLRCGQRHRLHVHARARHRPLAHQHHQQRHSDERRGEQPGVLGKHRRLCQFGAVDANPARRGHFHQRRGSLRSHAQHADRRHRHATLRGTRPVGGSYYSHKETLRFGTGLMHDHWALQGRLSNIGSKGYLDRASTKLNSYFLQAGYFGDNTMVKFITFNGNEQTYHAWNYASKYEQSLYGRRYNPCGEYYDADGNRHYYQNQTDNYHQQHYQLIWDQILDKDWNLSVALHYTKGQGYYEEYKAKRTWAEYLLTTDWNMLGDLVRQKKMDNDFYGAVASVNYDNHAGLTAIVGGGWNKYDGDHFGKVVWTGSPYYLLKDAQGNKYKQYVSTAGTLMPYSEYYRNNAKKTDGNVYGKVNWEFLKGLNAYADLQYRHVGYTMDGPTDKWDGTKQISYDLDDHFDFFNPKFGINWDITPSHKLYVSYAIAHKEPTRNDYEDNIGVNMKAERLNDLELGYKYLSSKFSAGVNFYYMYYHNQFVLTGKLNDIGEMIASNDNSGRSYRMGAEMEAAWQPVDWFRWDVNATWSKNRAKDWTVTDDKGKTVSLGDTHLSFSPDIIFNNIFSFNYKGFTASVQSQYIGEQYLTNTDFKSYRTQDDNGKDIDVSMMLDDYFTTNLNVAYNFHLPRLGIKDATVGVTLYNVFSAKYDNNGWAAPNFKTDANGKLQAYTDYDQYEAGFAPSAPFNVMAHLSINF